ncbi:MAG: hypothetical protein H6907_02355 [Hyphomicrobiales bacterium]|nr:hypothetical protein [Hyphomicrobiales bacterium]
MSGAVYHAAILRTGSLVPVLWRALRGRQVAILEVRAVFAPARRMLQAVRDRLVAGGRATSHVDSFPGADRFAGGYGAQYHIHSFARVEPWIEARYGFEGLAVADPAYGMAIKHATCNHIAARFMTLMLLRDLYQQLEPARVRIIGADTELADLYAAHEGIPAPFSGRRGTLAAVLANTVTTALAVAYGLAWIARRTRRRWPPAQPVLLAADVLPNERHLGLLREVIDDPAQLMLVFRSDATGAAAGPTITGASTCSQRDGKFSPSAALSAAGVVATHGLGLLRRYGAWPPVLFRRLAPMPFKRVMYRALWARFRPQHFLGRDDYNADHIIRSQELRRLGAQALGINHGLPVPEIINYAWRYIDFDVYFVFGKALHDRHYKRTWAPAMRVEAIGIWAMSRAQRMRLGSGTSRDILFFPNLSLFEDRIFDQVCRIAEAFPDRRLLVKLKATRKADGYFSPLAEKIRRGPANLAETEEDSYDLMTRAAYALTNDGTTIAAEAVQLGLATFVFDMDRNSPSYYREFPGLCVADGNEVIARIRAIEAGRETYPRENFAGLIDLSGRDPFDVIRASMGLPPSAVADLPVAAQAVGA